MEHDAFVKKHSIMLGVVALFLIALLFVVMGMKKTATALVPVSVVPQKEVVLPAHDGSKAAAKVQVLEPNITKATVLVRGSRRR
jgi:Na+-transporting methylmalonyl-CoA/oxaloacetate decarboxylase gamma subunit